MRNMLVKYLNKSKELPGSSTFSPSLTSSGDSLSDVRTITTQTSVEQHHSHVEQPKGKRKNDPKSSSLKHHGENLLKFLMIYDGRRAPTKTTTLNVNNKQTNKPKHIDNHIISISNDQMSKCAVRCYDNFGYGNFNVNKIEECTQCDAATCCTCCKKDSTVAHTDNNILEMNLTHHRRPNIRSRHFS